ncbi:unnamed protein product, partial [Prorocentrum cordatum]
HAHVPMSEAYKNFLPKPKEKEGSAAKSARTETEEPDAASKRDELILLASVAAESRNHAAALYRTCLVPGEVGEAFYDGMRGAVGEYEKKARGQRGHGHGVPCHHALIAAALIGQTHFSAEEMGAKPPEYQKIEEFLTKYDVPKKLGREVLEFRAYETRDKGHRFRFRLVEGGDPLVKAVVEIIVRVWMQAGGEEVLGSAPASKRERKLQARIKRMKE